MWKYKKMREKKAGHLDKKSFDKNRPNSYRSLLTLAIAASRRAPRGMSSTREEHSPTWLSPLANLITWRISKTHGVIPRLYTIAH